MALEEQIRQEEAEKRKNDVAEFVRREVATKLKRDFEER